MDSPQRPQSALRKPEAGRPSELCGDALKAWALGCRHASHGHRSAPKRAEIRSWEFLRYDCRDLGVIGPHLPQVLPVLPKAQDASKLAHGEFEAALSGEMYLCTLTVLLGHPLIVYYILIIHINNSWNWPVENKTLNCAPFLV